MQRVQLSKDGDLQGEEDKFNNKEAYKRRCEFGKADLLTKIK